MKTTYKILTTVILSLTCVSLYAGELIDVAPDGSKYYDPYSKQYTPGNHSLNVNSGLSQFKGSFTGLSKKKTSDVIIYPTPRG